MVSDLHHQNIEKISQELSQKLNEDFFSEKDYITGKDIAGLTSIEQINFFVFENLFGKWSEEVSKLKSPYFDYDHQDVLKALDDFMNKLSFHIKIDRDDFAPLLMTAIADTIYFVADPSSFIVEGYFGDKDTVLSSAEIKSLSKYIRWNKFLIDETVSELTANGKESFNGEEITRAFKLVYERKKDELFKPSELVANINNYIPVKLEDLFVVEKEMTEEEVISKVKLEEEPEEKIEDPVQVIEVPSTETENNVAEESEVPAKEESSEPTKDNDPKILHDSIKGDEAQTLVASHQKSKIASLRTSIVIHQKYVFVNQLFNGDSFAYEDAVNKLDTFSNLGEANNYINEELTSQFNWNDELKELKEFKEVIERRFA